MQEELEIDSGKEIFIEEAIFITEDIEEQDVYKEMQDLGEGALKKDINIILKDQKIIK